MSLVYTPYERLFNDIVKEFSDYPKISTDSYHTYSTKEAYTIEMPLIGVTKEEMEVKVEKNYLHINAKPTKTSKYIKNTTLTFSLNEDGDTDNIAAKLENGLLTVTIPRFKPEKKMVNIKIN